MTWSFSVALLPTFVAGAVAFGVAVLAWDHRSERTGKPFVVLMLSLAWWAIAYGVELGYSDLGAIVLWDKIAFVGSVTAPVAFFWLAVEYAGFDDDVPAWTPVVLIAEPVVTLLLVWSYPRSRLVWESVSVRESGALVLPVFDFGPWYWVNFGYSYVLVGSALVFIGYVFVRGRWIYRRQSALLILGAVVPLGANLLYNLFPALSPFPAIDLTTFAMTATGVLFGLSLFRFKILDLAPVARGLLLSEVGDGFVVGDADGAVVEGNEIGRRIVALDDAFDRPLPPEDLADLAGRIVSVPIDGAERSYEVRTGSVTDFRGERVGTLVVFRDITELEVIRGQEQRLSVMNRILRHNIRNEMNVVGGYGDLLAGALDGEHRRYADIISRRATRMASIGEKARHFGTELDVSGERESIDVVPVVDAAIGRVAAEFPSATVTLAGDDAAMALVTRREDLDLAVEYLLENAIEHNDADDPTVHVDVKSGEETVGIAVADNGPGIPPAEREIVEAGPETPLHHGSGLGLWVVYWLVSRSDGCLSFEENDPRGSVVTIRVPAAD